MRLSALLKLNWLSMHTGAIIQRSSYYKSYLLDFEGQQNLARVILWWLLKKRIHFAKGFASKKNIFMLKTIELLHKEIICPMPPMIWGRFFYMAHFQIFATSITRLNLHYSFLDIPHFIHYFCLLIIYLEKWQTPDLLNGFMQ